MSLVYLESMYSESCFSECSRNKQQALFLLKVSKLASVAWRLPCRAVPLLLGALAGLLLCLLFLMASETHTHTRTPPSNQPTSPPHSGRAQPTSDWAVARFRWHLLLSPASYS